MLRGPVAVMHAGDGDPRRRRMVGDGAEGPPLTRLQKLRGALRAHLPAGGGASDSEAWLDALCAAVGSRDSGVPPADADADADSKHFGEANGADITGAALAGAMPNGLFDGQPAGPAASPQPVPHQGGAAVPGQTGAGLPPDEGQLPREQAPAPWLDGEPDPLQQTAGADDSALETALVDAPAVAALTVSSDVY